MWPLVFVAMMGPAPTSATHEPARLEPARPEPAKIPTVVVGKPTCSCGYDKHVIQRYIHRQHAQIRHCYEAQLQGHPSLAGTVTARFTIAADGKVADSRATGVDDAVSSCIAGVIAAIEFPPDRGGGGLLVTYPFDLRPRIVQERF